MTNAVGVVAVLKRAFINQRELNLLPLLSFAT